MKPKKRTDPAVILGTGLGQSGAISGKKQQVKVEEEEDRDDFEGFGSITAMVQNKDKLVEKTLADDSF